MTLSLSWDARSRSGGHDDLVFRIGEYVHTCDSYYMAIDDTVMGRRCRRRTAAVLEALLTQWLRALAALPDGGTSFWPFDFSDQCTGWLRTARAGDTLSLQPGWSAIEGYSLYPSSYGAAKPTDWTPIAEARPLRMTLQQCTECVRDSILQLRRLLR